MSVPEFFAPAFAVTVNGTRLTADVTTNIEQLSVTLEPGTLDSFELTLANEYPAMRWTPSRDSPWFDAAQVLAEGTDIKIAMGYVDRLRTVFQGEVTKISADFPETGAPTVRVEGHTRMHWLLNPGIKAFPDSTIADIVRSIGKDVGLEVQAEVTGTCSDYMIQGGKTYFEFLRELAKKNHEVLVEGKTLIFRKRHLSDAKKYTFVWGHPQKGLAGAETLPLSSFRPELDAAKPVAGVLVRGYDPQTKREIIGRAGPGSEEANLGKRTAAQLSEQALRHKRTEIVVTNPVRSQEEADEIAFAEYNRKIMLLITGTGSMVGLPDLRPGQKVEVLGVGARFEGEYYVRSVTHSISGSGFHTEFSVSRNAR